MLTKRFQLGNELEVNTSQSLFDQRGTDEKWVYGRSPTRVSSMPKDVTDESQKSNFSERPRLESADANQARNAGLKDMKAVEGQRTNPSNGSLRNRTKPTAERDDSVHITGLDGRVASRVKPLNEKDLVSPENSAAKSISIKELLTKPDKAAKDLIEEFGRISTMPPGLIRDAALHDVQQLADKTYGRGQYADVLPPNNSSTGAINGDGRRHFQNPKLTPGQDVAGAAKEWLWNDAPRLPSQTFDGAWNISIQGAETVNRQFGHVDLKQSEVAYKAFGLDKIGIDKKLVAAIIWNEQLHLKLTDSLQDAWMSTGQSLDSGASIGPGQMQIQNIESLAKKYPMIRELGEPEKAASDNKKVPFFVAAYLAREADAIGRYNAEHKSESGFKPIPITTETLAYRYNPDVYEDVIGNYRHLEPWEKVAAKTGSLRGFKLQKWPVDGVVEQSHHLAKVRQAMNEVSKMR